MYLYVYVRRPKHVDNLRRLRYFRAESLGFHWAKRSLIVIKAPEPAEDVLRAYNRDELVP